MPECAGFRYLPGRRPVIETLLIYGVSLGLYVSMLGGVVAWCLQETGSTLVVFGILLAAWLRIRIGRRENWAVGKLEFEELPEVAVLTLSIERD